MTISWKAVIVAGIVAAVVFMVLQMLLVTVLMGGSPWGPPRLMAAVVLGTHVVPPPASFDLGIVMVGTVVQVAASLVTAAVLGFLLSLTGADFIWSVISGAMLGLAIYIVNLYGFTAVFPWFAEARSAATLFNHIIYGGLIGGVYRAVSAPFELPPTE